MDEPERHQNKNANNKVDALYNSWLRRVDSIKTFDDDPLVLEQDIVDIRQLLDESDKPEENVGCY